MSLRPEVSRAACNLELMQSDGESDEEFTARVAKTNLHEGGDAYESLELLTGKRYSEIGMGARLLVADLEADLQERKYSAARDTYYSMPWDEFVDVPISAGFRLVAERPYDYDMSRGELERTYLHTNLGAVLVARSYSKVVVEPSTNTLVSIPQSTLDSAYLRYEVRANEAQWDSDELYRGEMINTVDGSGGWWQIRYGNMYWHANLDVRLGLKETVEYLEAAHHTFGMLNKPWEFAEARTRRHLRCLAKEFRTPELAALVTCPRTRQR